MNRLVALLALALLVPPCGGKTEDDLTEADRQRLSTDKILIGAREFRQSFEPYINNDVPVFITSDALLNAFHVLFEESFARMEAANVPKLESLLTRIIKALPDAMSELKGVPGFKKGAAQRAEIMLKTALRLLGRPAQGSSKSIENFIAAQVREVESATGSRKPEWLGPPDDGFLALDFTRYAPRGFYGRSIRMQRYFRAVSWLQSVPFRVMQAEEYLAAKLIGRAAYLSQSKSAWEYLQRDPFLDSWGTLLGEWDDYSLPELINDGRSEDGLNFEYDEELQRRQRVEDKVWKERRQLLNDALRLPPGYVDAIIDPEYRLLPAAALPDAIMMQRRSQLRGGTEQRYPVALEVAAGLGSAFASATLSNQIAAGDWKEVQSAVKWLAEVEPGFSLYDEYLGCLRELVNTPETDAPDFLRSEPWQRKSCQTLLASWAQMRHALILQAKTVQHYLSATDLPPGFVEPDPEFFRRLGELSVRCLAVFAEAGAFDDNSEAVIFESLFRARDEAEFLRKAGSDQRWGRGDGEIERVYRRLGDRFPLPKTPELQKRNEDTTDEEWKRIEDTFEKSMTDYFGKLSDALTGIVAKMEAATSTDRAQRLEKMHLAEEKGMATRWRGLAQLCSQAHGIAHRQLRKVTLTEAEKSFIQRFGILLAAAMFYDGNSYLAPRDDAPRVADVFSGQEGHLHVATGRPRLLYVLYPWNNGEILCVGSVLPFYEFKHGPGRLTDGEWLEKLNSAPPDLPGWALPVQPDRGKSAPDSKGR